MADKRIVARGPVWSANQALLTSTMVSETIIDPYDSWRVLTIEGMRQKTALEIANRRGKHSVASVHREAQKHKSMKGFDDFQIHTFCLPIQNCYPFILDSANATHHF